MSQDANLETGITQLEAGRHAIALESFAVAADSSIELADRCSAMAFAADVSLELGKPYETLAWAERLRSSGGIAAEADVLEGAAWLAIGDGEQALPLLHESPGEQNPLRAYPSSVMHQLRCEAHRLMGNADLALGEAFRALEYDVRLSEVWRTLALVMDDAPLEVDATIALLSDDDVMNVLGWLTASPPTGTDRLVEGMWARWPGDRRLLALMATVANRLPLERAVEWSVRLRQGGLDQECAVLGIAARPDVDAMDRIRAALVASELFADPRAIPLLELAASALPDEDVRPALELVLEHGSDETVDLFVVAAASTCRRALDLSAALLRRGATTAAVALAKHAVELSTGQPIILRTASRLALDRPTSMRLRAELRRVGAFDAAVALDG